MDDDDDDDEAAAAAIGFTGDRVLKHWTVGSGNHVNTRMCARRA